MVDLIRWNDTQYGGLTGHVGSVDPWLFQIYRPDRADEEWLLSSQLPGHLGLLRHGSDRDSLKPEAEELLRQWLGSLGAVFPEPEAVVAADARPYNGQRHCLSCLARACWDIAGFLACADPDHIESAARALAARREQEG